MSLYACYTERLNQCTTGLWAQKNKNVSLPNRKHTGTGILQNLLHSYRLYHFKLLHIQSVRGIKLSSHLHLVAYV